MRAMQVGMVLAAVCLIMVGRTEGQQYTGTKETNGTCASGPVSVGSVLSQAVPSGGIVGQSVVSRGFPTTATPGVASYSTQGQILPYSYWVTAPQPARIYVEYGATDQFSFQGRAYGSPNDRWSWYYMGGGNGRYLARYYYPLLR